MALFLSRWWTIGFAVAAVAWVLHVAAMAIAPLSLVQAVIAGGLVLIAYPATRYFGHKLNRREWLGLGLAAAGLGFLAVTVPHASENERLLDRHAGRVRDRDGRRRLLPLRLRRSCAGARSATASCSGSPPGLLIGVSNVAIKALTEGIDIAGMQALISPWTVLAVIGGLGAFFALARGMQLGEAIPVIAPPRSPPTAPRSSAA